VFLAVLEKTGIIGAVLDVLPEKLSLRLLPGLGHHNQTVEVARFFGRKYRFLLGKGPIAQRLEQGTHNPIRPFPDFAAVCVSGFKSAINSNSFLPILRSFAGEIAREYRKAV